MLLLTIPWIGKVVQLDIDANIILPCTILFMLLFWAMPTPGTLTRTRSKGH
jgi:hypothetical protein